MAADHSKLIEFISKLDSSPSLREKYIDDQAKVMNEFGLSAEQQEVMLAGQSALRTLLGSTDPSMIVLYSKATIRKAAKKAKAKGKAGAKKKKSPKAKKKGNR